VSVLGIELPRRPRLPTSAADELGAAHRRHRRERVGLGVLTVALLVGLVLASRSLDALPTTYFAESTGGVVVLDLSTSVDAQKSQRMHRVLRTFAETEGRVGLVVFSDSAYEMFPPDTRSEELRPLLRFFAAQGAGRRPGFGFRRREGSEQQPAAVTIESPWSLSFRGGTRISTGLAEARRVVEREGDEKLSVLLLSDLDNSGFDTSALVDELQQYRREGIDLRVIPLFPAPEDRALFASLVGRESVVDRAELARNVGVRERQTLVGAFPWALVGLGAALLVALALAERRLGRLEWEAGR
jgi:hypothetical protein